MQMKRTDNAASRKQTAGIARPEKKPHIWNVAGLALITAILTAILAGEGLEEHAVQIIVLLDVSLFAVIIMLMRAFFLQLRFNPYSYNTIYYVGFSLFLLSVWITLMILTVRLIHNGDMYRGQRFIQITSLLSTSACSYMLLSAPAVLVFSIALCVSNLELIRREGLRLVNILGVILAALLVGGELFLFFGDYGVSGSAAEVRIHEMLCNVFAAVYLYFECMVIGVIVAYGITSKHEPSPDQDYLIILGCALRKDGTPSPLLRDRLDRAIEFRNRQLAVTGKELVFVTSGGQGSDEVISESEAMRRYLVEKGIPEQYILEEDQSTSTLENMRFSKEKIEEQNPNANIAFSTTNYHVFRSGLFARRTGMCAAGMGARAKWYFWPNALVREFVGLLTEHRKKQAMIIIGLIVVYVVLAYCALPI